MDTNYIKEFVTLAECMSFSEASNLLFISQSSLSKHIQTIERDLGVILFERTTRSIKLTDAGLAFLMYAQRIADLCDEAKISMDDIRNKTNRSLTIATMQNPQYYDLAKYIVSFQEAHPDITFQMVEADEFGLYDMLMRKQVNIIPTFELFQIEQDDCTFIPMVRSKIKAIFRADHPQATREAIDLKQLGTERLLLPTRNSTLHKLILDTLFAAGIRPDIVYEGSSTGCIDLVKAGMGVSLHAEGFTNTIKEDFMVRAVDIEPPIEFVYGVWHRNPSELSRAEQIYLSHLKKFELKE